LTEGEYDERTAMEPDRERQRGHPACGRRRPGASGGSD
jgi:hypothetical protein